MAISGSMRDGLGFEEVNQAVTYTDTISGTNVFGMSGTFGDATLTVGNITTGVITTGSITTVRTTNVNMVGSIIDVTTNASAKLMAASFGSPANWSAFVQGGSITTGAGSNVDVEFGRAYSANKWYITFTPTNFVAGCGSVVAHTSGTRTTSGATVVGGASTAYDYVVIGK